MATKSETAKRAARAAELREQEKAEDLKRLGQAIRQARGELTQSQLAELISRVRGQDGYVPQTMVSRWEAGMVDLSCTQLKEIETALGLQLGEIARAAGFIASEFKDLRPLIRSAPTIHPRFRGDVERILKSYEDMSAELFAVENEKPGRKRR